jgi:hypothetical protein
MHADAVSTIRLLIVIGVLIIIAVLVKREWPNWLRRPRPGKQSKPPISIKSFWKSVIAVVLLVRRAKMSKGSRRFLAAFIPIITPILFVGWWIFDGSTTWPRTLRCRRVITVDTPEGPRSGSNVVQLKTHFLGGMIRALGYAVRIEGRGEATVVDLGPRGLLFATLASEKWLASGGVEFYDGCEVPFPLGRFPGKIAKGGSSNDESVAYLDELNRQKPRGDVPFKYLPMLVRFRDPSDPASVERVDPSDLAASFGAGVKFERMSIEITDAPVTTGIEAVLPWLASRESQRLIPPPPGIGSLPPVNQLSDIDFRRLPQ